MASFLRHTCTAVGLRFSSRLPFEKFYTPHKTVAQLVPKRGYGGSAFVSRSNPRSASPEYVVGGTIAACTAVWLYAANTRLESNEPNKYLGRRHDKSSLVFLEQNFVASRKNVDEGRWWTIITSTFTHFAPAHLAVNMYTLWSFGRPIVMFYGVPTYALLWLGAGVGGSALQIYWSDIMKQAVKRKLIKKPFGIQDDVGGVGASASILGMIGVMSCAFPSNSLFTLGLVAGSILCIEYDWLPWIGHKSHLGGVTVGATWWFLFLRRRRGW